MDGRTPEEIRAETYADQNGSSFLGYGREFESASSTSSARTPRKPRPTGRPRTEVGGSDLSRIEANNDQLNNPMSPAEREEVRRGLGHSSALLMKEQLAYDLMMKRTEGDPQARAVALRKLADGKK